MSDLAGAWTFAEALDFCRSLDLNYTIEVVDSQEPCGHPGNADDNDLASSFGQNTSRSTLNSAK